MDSTNTKGCSKPYSYDDNEHNDVAAATAVAAGDCCYVALLSSGQQGSSTHKFARVSPMRRRCRTKTLAAAIISALVLATMLTLVLLSRRQKSLMQSINYPAATQLNHQRFYRTFEEFIAKYQKVYISIEEKLRRFEIFAQNVLYIELHNKQSFTYTLGINAFTDLTFEEFKSLHFTGYRASKNNKEQQQLLLGAEESQTAASADVELSNAAAAQSIPPVMNWKEKGCVSPVRDQRKCGSCWAFSAAGAVEGGYCAKHGVLLTLSEQQMVDCAFQEGNDGCQGGEMDDAFRYIMNHDGLCTEQSYPYIAKEGVCHDTSCKKVVRIDSFADVVRRNETALKVAVALKGPISAAIQADQLPFQFYHSGVFDGSCGTSLNHGVLVVGYGRDAVSQKEYWLVKNSWGVEWGEMGFIKLARGGGIDDGAGQCGILLDPSYPVTK